MRPTFMISTLVLFLTVASCGGSVKKDSLLTGTWKGTSICQVKPSACNDEIAVYHFSKGDKPNTYHVVANKIINGVEESMAESDYTFNPADSSLYCYIDQYKVTIKFIVKGKIMEGTLYSGKTLYRIIKLKKEG